MPITVVLQFVTYRAVMVVPYDAFWMWKRTIVRKK